MSVAGFNSLMDIQITAFNPQIITENAKPTIELFAALGFEVCHDLRGVGEQGDEGIRMKDANGFHLDIAQTNIPIPHDMVAIRMNVDDFDKAFRLLAGHGFANFYGEKTLETESSRSTLMISPSGFGINLVQHIKDHA